MQTVTRWKIACMLFAAATAAQTLRDHRVAGDIRSPEVQTHSSAIPLALRRPIRITAGALGISERDLIDRILAAKSLRDLQVLCEKLAAVGTDDSVEALGGMLADPRPGVPERILAAFAAIGTERAIDVVLNATSDERLLVKAAAIAALGASQSEKAERVLLEIASKAGDPMQDTAIAALGRFASEPAVAKLIDLAKSPDYSIAAAAVSALGTASTPSAEAAVRALLDAPDSRIAAAAWASIEDVDDELLSKITAVVKTGNAQLVQAAISALANTGGAALPLLREAALHGVADTQFAAIEAIGSVGGDRAIAVLGEIMNARDRRSAPYAASQLARLGGPEARELLISAALSDDAQSTGALAQLAQLSGADVDHVLLSVMKQGTGADRREVLPRLLRAGNSEAFDIAIDLATKGSLTERSEMIRLLGDSRSRRAVDALIDIAAKTRGSVRTQSLAVLTQSHPTDPAVSRMLSETLRSGRRDEAIEAADLLGRVGTEAARQALVSALTAKNSAAALAAANALGRSGVSDNVKAALISAASSSSEMKLEVMTQLVQAGAPEGLRFAHELIEGEGGREASQAVWILSRQNTPEAKQLLDVALRSKEPAVRAAALSGIAEATGTPSIDTLLRFVHDDDSSVRTTALSHLGQLGTERAQTALLSAARQGAVDDRIAAIRSLMNVDDSRVDSELANFMRDPDPNVAVAAISAASRGGSEVDPQLIRLINDQNAEEEVRRAAAVQLRDRGATVDSSTEAAIDRLAGASEVPEVDVHFQSEEID